MTYSVRRASDQHQPRTNDARIESRGIFSFLGSRDRLNSAAAGIKNSRRWLKVNSASGGFNFSSIASRPERSRACNVLNWRVLLRFVNALLNGSESTISVKSQLRGTAPAAFGQTKPTRLKTRYESALRICLLPRGARFRRSNAISFLEIKISKAGKSG